MIKRGCCVFLVKSKNMHVGWSHFSESNRSLREGGLDVVEQVTLLPAGISDELSIDVVRVLG